MTDGPLSVPLEYVGTIISGIFERGADRIIIDRDHDGYVVLVDGIGCSDPDEFATALWYIDAMHAIATADRSWPAGNDPRLPHNPKRKVV